MVLVRSAPGGAEQNDPAPWVGHTCDLAGQVGEPSQRGVLGAGEFLGAVIGDQVGAGGRADQQ